jgi:sulfite exporter TauE/SafE
LNSLALFPLFLVGLFGGVHCVGMCGGIVGAFGVAAPTRATFPIPVVSQSRAVTPHSYSFLRVLLFNAGRITSYMLAGAVMAGIVGSVSLFINLTVLQKVGYVAANLMLIALGLSLMQIWSGITQLEKLGQLLWQRLQPLLQVFIPIEKPWQAFALGAIWGWVPCAMVYSVLMTALMTGSALQGALVMLAFGLGTLPLLITMGWLSQSLPTFFRKAQVRFMAGLLVLLFGLLGVYRLVTGLSHGWLDALCLTPAGM